MRLTREDLETISVYFNTLLIGAPKEGKTTSIDTLHDFLVKTKSPSTKVFMYDLDDGAVSLLRRAHQKKWVQDLEIFRYYRKQGNKLNTVAEPVRSQDQWNEFSKEFNQLYDMVDPRTGKWKDPANSPGVVVVDSISAIKDVITDFILNIRNKELTGTDGGGVTYTEQALFKEKFKAVINGLKGLPCHTVMTAHVELRQEMNKSGSNKIDSTSTGNSFIVPIIFGDMRWNLTSYFDAVLFTKPNWKWQTKPDGKIKGCGVRTTEGLEAIIDQNFELIFNPMKSKPLPPGATIPPNVEVPTNIQGPAPGNDTSVV